jgi:hypothetical protein
MKFSIKDRGDQVSDIQTALAKSGFTPGAIDGEFGPKTEQAVKKYQLSMGLKSDGVVGIATAKALSIAALLQVPEKGRRNFTDLISINPNYFGNLPSSVFSAVENISGNTSYEEISCIGYSPALKYLEATVQIKKNSGYNGSLCSDGSIEYVRFYIDYGSGWQDLGSAAFDAYDIPAEKDCADRSVHPLSYALTLEIDPPIRFCKDTLLPRVRAILSWQIEPPAGDPNWTPVWGNVLERNIQIKPYKFLLPWPPIFEKKEVAEMVNSGLFSAPPTPITLADASLVKEYKAKKVETERLVYSDVAPIVNSTQFNLSPAALSSKYMNWKQLNIDLASIIPNLTKLWGNTSYEEMHCLGLDYNRDLLEATVHIKRPSGYISGPCSAGSYEYVSFWADWDDDCQWKYQGTVKINVHDFADIPAEGLHYAAILPVDLSKVRRSCDKPKLARVRAVLSWNSPPSTTNPNQLSTYGNRLDSHVLIRPAEQIPDGAYLSIIGGVGSASINTSGNGKTMANAKMVPWGTYADPHDPSRECPFGGLISLMAPRPLNPVFSKYRIFVREQNAAAESLLTQSINIVNADGVTSLLSPDSNGYFPYLDVYSNVQSLLANWHTSSGQNGIWEVRLEASNATNTITDSTVWHKIALDNTKPSAVLTVDGGDCQTYSQGDDITGQVVAQDSHFGHYTLTTTPGSLSPPQPVPSYSNTQTPSTGAPWSVQTTTSTPACGYVITLRVWDRTIVGSRPGSHNRAVDDTGLCLKEGGNK